MLNMSQMIVLLSSSVETSLVYKTILTNEHEMVLIHNNFNAQNKFRKGWNKTNFQNVGAVLIPWTISHEYRVCLGCALTNGV